MARITRLHHQYRETSAFGYEERRFEGNGGIT